MVINMFDPLGFLKVAENLSNGNNEAQFRTSVSRSYYSVFLATREKVESRNGKFQLERYGDIHQVLIDRLKSLR